MNALLRNTSVFVVDDDPDTCELLRHALEESGASVVVVASVEAALEEFRRCPPHAVVADIRIGASDGYVLLKEIQHLNMEYKGFTSVVAVTGFASPEDEHRALAAGFSAYFAKPFDPAEVVHTIAGSLRNAAGLAA